MAELVEGIFGSLPHWWSQVGSQANDASLKRLHIEHYITLGQNIVTLLNMLDDPHRHLASASFLRDGERRELNQVQAQIAILGQLRDHCSELGLTLSVETIDATVLSGISHSSQIKTLVLMVQRDMSKRLFLQVPDNRSSYWETNDLLSGRARTVFKAGAAEVRASGTAYAYGLWSASIFHSMRAAEDALKALSDEFGLERAGAEQWGNIINRIEAKLVEIAKQPKASDEKKRHLQPLSELVMDLRLFKDAWRNQNSHAVVEYSEKQALDVLNAVCRVLNASAPRLSR